MTDIRRCGACGAKHRDSRVRCLRCGAALAAIPAIVPAKRPRWLPGAAAGIVVVLAGGGWMLSRSSAQPHVLAGTHSPSLAPAAASAEPSRAEGGDTAAVPGLDPAPAANAAYARGDYAGALLGFQRAMADHPDDPAAINNVGQILVRLGRAAEAVPLFEKAVTARPGEWSYRFNLARARAQLRDWPAAVADYREAERLFPDDGPTLFNFGLALQQTGADAEAATVLERALAANPEDPSFVLALARSYQRLARTADARRAFERFLDLSPQSADAAAARQALTTLSGAPGEAAPSSRQPPVSPAEPPAR